MSEVGTKDGAVAGAVVTGFGAAQPSPRQQALERLLDEREHARSLTEGQWSILTAHVVDAALSGDDPTLEAAYTGLQWMAAELGRRGSDDGEPIESALEKGRVKGVLDIVRWHLRRSVTAAAPALPPEGLAARMLRSIAQRPGSRNQEIARSLAVDETQVSRAGRHLRASTLATVQRVGRENAWYVTPRGLACLRLVGTDVERDDSLSTGELPAKEYAQVLTNILESEPGDEAEVQRGTGLPHVTVAQALDFLVTHGYVVKEPERPGGPPSLRVNERQYGAIGVSVAQGVVVGVLADLRARDLATASRAVDTTNVEDVVASINQLCRELLSGESVDTREVIGLGVNLPGHVDPRRGVVLYSPLGPSGEWTDVDLASRLVNETKLPTTVENDVNALALHEKYFGEGQGLCDFAVVFVTPDGEGVGSGLVVGGSLVHGSTGSAGEIGHAPLGDGSRQCRCSNYGCLEATVGFSSMKARLSEAGVQVPAGLAEVSMRASDGDAQVRDAFAEAGSAFGRGVATILSTLDPELAILSGPRELIDIDGTVPSATAFTRAAREAIRRHSFGRTASHCQLVTKRLTGEYAARGAASALLLGRLYESSEESVVDESSRPALESARR
ncbi:ROK family protein [Blastococcus sp. SYSU DS0619]